jgi:thiol-disulfide isomerase/thioredoxin
MMILAVLAAPSAAGADLSEQETLDLLSDIGLQPVESPIDAEDFDLPMLAQDGSRTLSSYEGKLVLLNFWATWCPPCKEEMPSMQTLYEELGRDDFEIVAVNLQEDPETVQSFIDEHGFNFPVLLDRSGQTARQYAVRGIPTSYIVDQQGRILARKVGFHEWDGSDTIAAFETLSRF